MSVGNIMRTSTAGMNAQASKLSVVSENVANADTSGYKRSETEFSSLVMPQTTGTYTSGSVQAVTRNTISLAGNLNYTGNAHDTKKLDLAVDGEGFFVVGDGVQGSNGNFLSRAGSFTMQADGTLVNAAGYRLRGYPIGTNGTDAVLNGFAGLQDVNLNSGLLSATPSTSGTLTYPLDQSFITGTKATNTQANSFSTTVGGTGAANTDTMTFNVVMDGTTYPVSVGSATGLAGIQAADVVSAINTAVGANVASLSTSGKLVLTSKGSNSGTGSTLSITAPSKGAGVASTVTLSVTGLDAFTASGTQAVDPGANSAALPSTQSTVSASMTVYNNAGEAVKLDIYYTKVDDATNTWKMAIFDGRDAASGTATSPFPYKTPALATASLSFDPANGYKLKTITPGAGTGQIDNKVLSVNLAAIGGGNFNLDIGSTTQLYKPSSQALTASANGNPPEVVKTISVGDDGVVTAQFTSGTTRDLFKIPLAKVTSPDSLSAVSGNAYQVGVESGTILMGTGGANGFGKVTAGALEDSNVDLATELTNMITAQRSYTANSKVFQTGSEILDVLVNLKR
ncbi:hypothetical protein GCM10011390_43850 [Aureimonas endophytica]|uniref:Flagellar hook protein FlgE n=1 Tax=Aureimonas endophytica TaxID=2027858 RepID=A0A917EAQ6_9HYPH|nr:flagellar hook-basal body complex protein [Aureimonas endophytica]GGE19815.1 hypothetical protein GCM10011390_43850 [Aureimonas endophytica]